MSGLKLNATVDGALPASVPKSKLAVRVRINTRC